MFLGKENLVDTSHFKLQWQSGNVEAKLITYDFTVKKISACCCLGKLMREYCEVEIDDSDIEDEELYNASRRFQSIKHHFETKAIPDDGIREQPEPKPPDSSSIVLNGQSYEKMSTLNNNQSDESFPDQSDLKNICTLDNTGLPGHGLETASALKDKCSDGIH
ncbi:hypothetical protein ScPMuIL_009530 [Solemya velum]